MILFLFSLTMSGSFLLGLKVCFLMQERAERRERSTTERL